MGIFIITAFKTFIDLERVHHYMTVALSGALIITTAVLSLMLYKVHTVVMEEGSWTQNWFKPWGDYEETMYNRYKLQFSERLNGGKILLLVIGATALTFIISYVFITGLLEILFYR